MIRILNIEHPSGGLKPGLSPRSVAFQCGNHAVVEEASILQSRRDQATPRVGRGATAHNSSPRHGNSWSFRLCQWRVIVIEIQLSIKKYEFSKNYMKGNMKCVILSIKKVFLFLGGFGGHFFWNGFPKYAFLVWSKACDMYIQNILIGKTDVLNIHITYFWLNPEKISWQVEN